MDIPNQLLEQNTRWADQILEQDANLFPKLAKGQSPRIFMIGCSDSRVPLNQIVNARPGDIFVHRNIANLVKASDVNCMSALHYAVQHLYVPHIIICGHYNCGGVQAAAQKSAQGMVAEWINDINAMIALHQDWLDAVPEEKRLDCLCELNVFQQVFNVSQLEMVQEWWAAGNSLQIHAWVFNLSTGRLVPSQPPVASRDQSRELYDQSIANLKHNYC